METIINPGLQHLAEKIFLNLNGEDLKACQLINQSANQILDNNPMFWLRKCIQKGICKENKEDWFKGVQSELNSNKEKTITLYLKWNFMNIWAGDLPQYTSTIVQYDFMEKIYHAVCIGCTKTITILATLVNNPNAPKNDGKTPIHEAALRGHTEIVKILAPLTDNPNAPHYCFDITVSE